MGRAFGTPIPATIDGPQLRAAEGQAYERLGQHYPGGAPDVLWRVEAVSYAVGDEYGGWTSTGPRLELFVLPVRKWTPCGARLEEGRWVDLQPDRKQYASRTPDEALQQFINRRKAQIRILEKQLARAKRELRLAEPPKPNGVPELIRAMKGPHLNAALFGFLSTRCDVSSQHKLPTLDEIKSTAWAAYFTPEAIDVAVRGAILAGQIFEYGPYLSDREIEVM